ncbi:hypothetical protein BT96DRAFT_990528 [Gymnopus androsaceus JB14]|uniref:G-patch domain-containing protein n=1 Tax=Gymnopus androsaceus JB14 TaxID=1447944 RepID=A0A6A4HV04_9AGAR|nr:hypothetical protein BT96DRAFT_990528 [Gymnopus androsaceus JB14]
MSRDEKGRRRLHGAFTGGFSAGYFNTVGSKEGWTPQTFVSSRSDRSRTKTAKPEDFMDEEDLQDIKDSRKIVDTTDEMDLVSGQTENQDDDPLTAALQSAMLPPSKDSTGARILKKMGWRVGQGVGPRITLKQRRLQDLQASTGAGQPMDASLDEDSEEANKHTYAPRDTPNPCCRTKRQQPWGGGSTSTGPKLSSGFGLGALNDADEDDLDVYEGGSANRNRLAYDATDDHDGDRISVGGSKSKLGSTSGPSSTVKEPSTAVLPGFMLSGKPVMEDRWYPLPDIPPGWKPDPKRVWSQSSSNSNKENVEAERCCCCDAAWQVESNEDRLLGETPLPSAPRSVFDFMSQKDRERLKNIAANLHSSSSGPAEPSSSAVPALAPATTPRIPRTDPQIARAALRGFQPFSANPVKQARYIAYLQSQADVESTITLEPLSHQSIPEFNSEMEEYAQSALIFKPMSGAMAGRFTSAAVVEHGPKVVEGLHTPSDLDKDKEEKVEEKKEKELSPKENAAKLGMYGPLTREVKLWQPARLLCKRFGVKDPNPEPPAEPEPSSQDPTSSTLDPSSSSGATFSAAEFGITSTSNVGSVSAGGPRDLANVGLGDEDETQGRDTLSYERPSVDVFKAIFASDDEDSSDDEDGTGAGADRDDDTKPSSITAPVVATATSTVVPVPSSIPAIPDDQPIDLNTFKPTFVKREARTKVDSDSVKQSKDKKEKKEKKKEKRKAIVSFMDDVGEGGNSLHVVVDKPRKKRKKDKEKDKDKSKGEQEVNPSRTRPGVVADGDEDMWVEKPAPAGVLAQASPSVQPRSSVDIDEEMVPSEGKGAGPEVVPRGRKKAIDFM